MKNGKDTPCSRREKLVPKHIGQQLKPKMLKAALRAFSHPVDGNWSDTARHKSALK
jgi:hypothetical protein